MARPGAPAGLPQTTVVQVGAASYYVRNQVEASLPSSLLNLSSGYVTPAVVLRHDGPLSLATILDTLNRFLQTDDVFQDGFMRDAHLIVQSSVNPQSVSNDAAQHGLDDDAASHDAIPDDLAHYLKSRSLSLLLTEPLSVPEGPYFVRDGQLHEAWRLWPDHLSAFAASVVPDDSASESPATKRLFKSLHSSAFTGAEASIAVPSRLYFKQSDEKPLNGRRVAVKDNMHLRGLVTGLGNKAYAELYGEQLESAELLQLLIDKGAIIVGKTKLSAFAGSEIPPCQCIDYFPPWNPRGDGYQGPSGSSSGAGASIAGYEWLDVSLCTDTTGSMRFPASSHGVWGHRASWNSLSMEGIVPACAPFDTFGILSRTVDQVEDVLTASGLQLEPRMWPTRILLPREWFPVGNEAQQRMTDEFIKALESSLGVGHTEFSFEEEWARTGPEHLRNKTVLQIEDMAAALNGYDNYHNFETFRSEYEQKFQRPPYVSPSHTARWKMDMDEPASVREQAFEQVTAFRNWALETLFSLQPDCTSTTIILVPHGRPGANYRDAVSPPPPPPPPSTGDDKPPSNISPIFIISMIGGPQVLVPIGQNPYDSRVSNQEEFAPIFTTIVGAPGSDLVLLKVGQETLKKAGWPTTVLTGRTMFEVGENERNSREPQPKL